MSEQAPAPQPEQKINSIINALESQAPKKDEASKTPAPAQKSEEWRNVDEVKAIIQQRDEAKKNAREMQARLEQLEKADRERSERDANAQQEAERKRLESEGKYAEALQLHQRKAETTLSTYRQNVEKRLIPDAIKSAAASIEGIAPEAIDLLPALLRDRVKLSDDLNLQVVGDDGKPLMDDNLKPVQLNDYVANFVKGKALFMSSRMTGSTGLRPGMLSSDGRAQRTAEEILSDPKAERELMEKDPAMHQKLTQELLDMHIQKAKQKK